MNTGIVTFHCSYNYGSALQAYALQIAVKSSVIRRLLLTIDLKILILINCLGCVSLKIW